MEPEVATMSETARSCFRKAQASVLTGDHDSVVKECKNAILAACMAIKRAGFGDASLTFTRLFGVFPANTQDVIQTTLATLKTLEKMAPPEAPLYFA